MLIPLLVVAFIVVPIAELYVIIQVGQAIGVPETIGLLILDSILGSLLLRSQGRSAWRRFNAALGEGRPPAREVTDGALVIFGGAFLLTPGFLTDIVGVVLLLPPTRAVVRRALAAVFARRFVAQVAGAPAGAGTRGRSQSPHAGQDVEGTADEVDQAHLGP